MEMVQRLQALPCLWEEMDIVFSVLDGKDNVAEVVKVSPCDGMGGCRGALSIGNFHIVAA